MDTKHKILKKESSLILEYIKKLSQNAKKTPNIKQTKKNPQNKNQNHQRKIQKRQNRFTIDVEAVLVQAIGTQLRDAFGLVAHLEVEAHPVQGQVQRLLPVGADGIHSSAVHFCQGPGKHSAELNTLLCNPSLQGQASGIKQPSLVGNQISAFITCVCKEASHSSLAELTHWGC